MSNITKQKSAFKTSQFNSQIHRQISDTTSKTSSCLIICLHTKPRTKKFIKTAKTDPSMMTVKTPTLFFLSLQSLELHQQQETHWDVHALRSLPFTKWHKKKRLSRYLEEIWKWNMRRRRNSSYHHVLEWKSLLIKLEMMWWRGEEIGFFWLF